MEHLVFIASDAVCICFNQIFCIRRRNVTLLQALHTPHKGTYSLIFLLLFPNMSIHGFYLEARMKISSAVVGVRLKAD